MNLPTIKTQIASKVHHLNTNHKINIMQYVNTESEAAVRYNENYRKNALRQIRKALKAI